MRTLNIELPDLAYDEVARAAADSGLSVEAYVADFVQVGLSSENKYAPLTSRQLQVISEAKRDVEEGRFFTVEQVRDQVATSKAAWLQSQSL